MHKKNIPGFGFDSLRLPSKTYLIQLLNSLNKTHDVFEKDDSYLFVNYLKSNFINVYIIKIRLKDNIQLFKVFGKKKKRGFFKMTKEELDYKNKKIQERK